MIVVGNAQIIAQLNPKICYIVCMLITMLLGMALGSIRSLQRLGWLCNASVWMNIVSFIIVMVAAANYGIDYHFIFNSTLINVAEPVKTFAGPPPDAYQMSAYGTFLPPRLAVNHRS